MTAALWAAAARGGAWVWRALAALAGLAGIYWLARRDGRADALREMKEATDAENIERRKAREHIDDSVGADSQWRERLRDWADRAD